MASQPTPCADLKVAEFNSFIRGYHAYKDIWIPVPGDVLILKREPDNVKDKSAVAICNEGDIVGHVPYNISSLLSQLLKERVQQRLCGGYRKPCEPRRWIWFGDSVRLQTLWTSALR